MSPESDAEWRDRLAAALRDGDDDAISRPDAAMYLNSDFPEVFPIRDDERGRWIIKAERGSLDGRAFLSAIISIVEDDAECPECGNRRTEHGSWNNGVVGGYRIACTVCGYVHEEDAG